MTKEMFAVVHLFQGIVHEIKIFPEWDKAREAADKKIVEEYGELVEEQNGDNEIILEQAEFVPGDTHDPQEDEIMSVIEHHGNKLTCSNCGKALSEVGVSREGEDKLIAELCFDPGESNYPREPDVPATIYFVCGEYVGEREDRRCILLDKASVKAALIDRMEQDGLHVQSGSYLDKRVEDFYLFVDDALRGFLDDQYHIFVEEAEK